MKNNNKYIRIIGIILFFYILSRINLQELFLALKNINLSYFFLAIILLPASIIIGILKWKILINSQSIKISSNLINEIFLKGLFWGVVSPARLGEFLKAKYLTEAVDISGGRAFYTILMDRIIDLLIIIAVGMVGIINLFLFNKIKIGWTIFVLLSILFLFTIYFLVRREDTKKIFKFSLKILNFSSIRKKTDSFFDEFFNGMKELNSVLFSKLIGYGFLHYLVTVLIYYLLALSLGINITFFHLFLIVALVLIILLIPITILGLGTREAGYIFFFAIFNITAATAVAFSSLILFVSIILSIPGMILFLKNNRIYKLNSGTQ